jgi:hypothetical protein
VRRDATNPANIAQSESRFISNLGPEFYVGAGRKRWSFQRAEDGPEEGSVEVSLWVDGEIHHSVTIDAAGWESVLAHACEAGHDGASFEAAKKFHEAERHAEVDRG